jgi:mono/diheme cytochrome c family protein
MMRSAKILGALVLAVSAALLGPNVASAETTDRAKFEQQELFRAKCGMCHRQGGTGTFMLGRRLGTENALLEERTNLTPEFVRFVVRNGIMSMPRFTRGELSDVELDTLVKYLTRTAEKE